MDYVGEILALSVDGIVFFICLKQYLKNRRVMNELKVAPVYEINSDLENIVRAQKENKIPYAVVRGQVKAIGVPIDSSSAQGITGVIQKITVREHVVSKGSHGFWNDSKRIVQETNNSVPFVLVGKSEGTKIEVLDAPTHAEMLELTTISDRFQPTESSGIVEHVWGYFTGIRRRGVQTTEEMLKEGSIVTGVGEIALNVDGSESFHPNVFDDVKYVVSVPLPAESANKPTLLSMGKSANIADSGYGFLENNALKLQSCSHELKSDQATLRIQQPIKGNLPLILSHLPLPSLITRLEGRKKAFGWATAVLGLSGVILSCWIAYKWMSAKKRKIEEEERKRRRELERRQRRRQARVTTEKHRTTNSDRSEEYEEAQLCVVCRENPKELILMPCGHVCLCEDCFESINSKCPVCRAEVQNVNVAYIA